MTRNIFIFLATFAVGAVIAFVARAALHRPHLAAVEHTAIERAPMVNAAPASAVAALSAERKAPSDHASHAANATASPTTAAKPVNTVCAICGMEVDPKIPTLEYQGKTVGFGCKLCAPKFKADPDKYGPIYLRNEVIKR